MFENGASQAEMNRAVTWFYGMQDQSRRSARRPTVRAASLRRASCSPSGAGDFKVNMNAMGSLLATMPDALKNDMLTRTPGGQMLGDTPGFIRWAAAQAREAQSASTIVPPGDKNAGVTIASEIAAIEKTMYLADGTANPAYWKGAEGEAAQKRYRELVDAQSKMTARGKAA